MNGHKINQIGYSYLSFLKHHVNGGMLLMVIALLAMIVANSPFSDEYLSFWNNHVSLQIGDFNLFSHHGKPLTLLEFINDALMVIFFFSVGLEIKREVLVGELSTFRQAMLPIIAACGGMVLPVAIYSLLLNDGVASRGLAIPMATDIAFSLGVLSLLGKRVPLSLKIFLTAFAVVDDIGGILVIALFYSSHIDAKFLLLAAIILIGLIWANRLGIVNKTFYILFGIAVWYLFLQSGVHSTIAGVLVAFTIPAQPSLRIGKYIQQIREKINSFPASAKESIVLRKSQLENLKSIEFASNHVISPLQSMEDSLQGVVNYFVMPLFAFANAGIVFSGGGGEIVGRVTYAVCAGLLLGKFLGIFTFTWIAVKTKIVSMPKGMCWKNLAGVSLLGGIGFTVSLFIANLSFAGINSTLLNQAKLGIIGGTVLSGILGYIVLYKVLPRTKE